MKQLDIRKFIVEACFFTLIWQLSAWMLIYLLNPGIFVSVLPGIFYSKLIAQELLIVALLSIVAFLTLRTFYSFVFFFSPTLSFAFCMLSYALIVTVYIFSWMQFLVYGKFINLSSIQMFVSSPFQMLLHAEDIAELSIDRIVIIPALILCSLYVLKKYILILFPSKFLFSVLVLFNIACAIFSIFRIDESLYTRVYIKVGATPISVSDYMRKLKVSSAGPLVTLKESAINQLIADSAWQVEDGIEFSDILPSDNIEGLLHLSEENNWDVIFLVIESLRPKALSAINANLQSSVMPSIDAVAADSQIFTNVYAQSSHSSYADMVPLSSQYPLRSISSYVYPKDIIYPKIMIYDVLSKFGYKSAIISSQNEEWQGMNNFLESPNLDVFIHAGNYQEILDKYKLKVEGINSYKAKPDPVVSFAGKLTDRSTVSIVNSWVSTLNKDDRYFLYTNLQNSHFPFFTSANGTPRYFASKEEEERVRNKIRKRKNYNLDEYQNLYHESLSGIDNEFRRLVEHLQHLGRWENTLLVITADTSILLSEHVVGNGGDLFKEVLHVPLVIKVPGMLAGKDSRLMQHLDVAPTVLGYMGVNKHPGFQGKDFSKPQSCNSFSFSVAQTPLAYQYSVISNDGFKLTFDAVTNHMHMELLSNSEDIDKQRFEKKKNDLFLVLKTWISGQIGYYNNDVLMSSKYPPGFRFNDSACE